MGMRKSFISRQLTISSTKSRGGGTTGRGQCLETKASENAGGADIPGIRNYEGARSVVKRAETNCLFVLGDAHRSCLEITSSPSYSFSLTYVLCRPVDLAQVDQRWLFKPRQQERHCPN